MKVIDVKALAEHANVAFQVMASFLAVAWFTVFVAVVPATYDILHTGPEPEPGMSGADIRRESKRQKPLWVKTMKNLLGPLCDIQAITGIAIVIAGFTQWNSIAFYHESLVMSYWWVTLNSFWVGRVDYMDPDEEQSPKIFVRRLVIFMSCVLGITFQCMVQVRETGPLWDDSTKEHCYRWRDDTSAWPWVGGTSIYAFALLLVMIPPARPWVHKYLDGTRDGLHDLKDKLIIQYHEFRMPLPPHGRTGPFTAHIIKFLLLAFVALAFGFCWIIAQFLSIWSYGDGWNPLLLLAYTGFGIWNTFDVVTLKVLNKPLIDGDELKMGFGQVLPLVLVVQIGFNIIDLWEGGFNIDLSVD
jgi:hypothetical protein